MSQVRFPLGVVPALAMGATDQKTYVVKKGDTLSAIAKDFNISLSRLQAANPQLKDPNQLKIGMRLQLPAPQSDPPSPDPAPVAATQPTDAPSKFSASRLITVKELDGKCIAQLAENGRVLDQLDLGERGKRGGFAYGGQVQIKTVLDRQNVQAPKQRGISPEQVLVWLTSLNEGCFDAVNTESPTDGLAVGIMQWQPLSGDLPEMLYNFQEKKPDDYKRCFVAHGIFVKRTVDEKPDGKNIIRYTLSYYEKPLVEQGKKGAQISEAVKPDLDKIAAACCFAGRDPAFQDFQLNTATERLMRSLNMTIDPPSDPKSNWPSATYSPKVIELLDTYLGVSMVFDMHVNHGAGNTDRIVEKAAHGLCKKYGPAGLKDQNLLIAAIIVARKKEFKGSARAIQTRIDKIFARFNHAANQAQADDVKAKLAQLEKDKVFQ